MKTMGDWNQTAVETQDTARQIHSCVGETQTLPDRFLLATRSPPIGVVPESRMRPFKVRLAVKLSVTLGLIRLGKPLFISRPAEREG